jgi:signal transduction histidine kinase
MGDEQLLDRIDSISLKLGLVGFAAALMTLVVNELGINWDVPVPLRLAAAVLLSLMMVQVLARGLTAPVLELADAARDMARGNYGRRVKVTSNDEIGELGRSFNRMAAELAESDRLRRDLVANVSHELRTPISALQARLENLVDGVEQPDNEVLGAMLSQVQRLGRLVTQLLDLSRLEAGTVPLDRRRFVVRSLLDEVAREALLHDPNALVEVSATTGLEVDGDPERLHQVVANLLGNALRHAPADQPVRLFARSAPGEVVIEVLDSGPGIPAEQAERVFDRFFRADPARSANDGGAGLGLAIARWIVELHGGTITAERNEPHGARMIVTLPDPA